MLASKDGDFAGRFCCGERGRFPSLLVGTARTPRPYSRHALGCTGRPTGEEARTPIHGTSTRRRVLQLEEAGRGPPLPTNRHRPVLLSSSCLAAGVIGKHQSLRAEQRCRGRLPCNSLGHDASAAERRVQARTSGAPDDVADHAADEDPRRTVEAADFRRGIDGLAPTVPEKLQHDQFTGTVFVFRNRKGTAVKVLALDVQPGFWLCHKRLSQGRFPCVQWPLGRFR